MSRTSPDDEGSALLIAVLTTGVCLTLALVGVGVAQTATRASGVDRQRLIAVNAAEAGIDAGYVAIQRGSASPPCSLSAANIKSGPDTASYATTVTYYSSAGAVMACPLGGTPAQALVRSTATTNTLGGGSTRGTRTFEALVNLNPVNGVTLSKAIFADGSLSFDNKSTITGNNGPDADIYTNAAYSCANNGDFQGSVYSQGAITLGNSCKIGGNLWAKTGISTSPAWNGAVTGFAKNSTGTIALTQGPGTVAGNLYAGGAISYGACSVGKCFPNNSPGDPPAQSFPILRRDQATLDKWAAGYTAGGTVVAPYTVIKDSDCTNIASNIVNTYARSGANTLVSTPCLVALTSDVLLKNDLAIFASGGITTGKIKLASQDGMTQRNVHFVVPYDAVAARPCSTPVLDTGKQFSIAPEVDLFIYSPCDVNYSNLSMQVGQIYGGSSVSVVNQFTMQFRPVPVLGIDPTSLPTVSYTPSVVYKRETN